MFKALWGFLRGHGEDHCLVALTPTPESDFDIPDSEIKMLQTGVISVGEARNKQGRPKADSFVSGWMVDGTGVLKKSVEAEIIRRKMSLIPISKSKSQGIRPAPECPQCGSTITIHQSHCGYRGER